MTRARGVWLEWFVDPRNHHEHHQHGCDEHRREADRGVIAEPARDGRQRAEHETEHRAEEELPGVVEVVVASTRLRRVDDLRKEGSKRDDTSPDAEGELAWTPERRGPRRRRRDGGGCRVVSAGRERPAPSVGGGEVVPASPRFADERDQLQEKGEKAEREDEREHAAHEAVARGAGGLDCVAARDPSAPSTNQVPVSP